MKSLVTNYTADYDVSGIVDPFLQVKTATSNKYIYEKLGSNPKSFQTNGKRRRGY